MEGARPWKIARAAVVPTHDDVKCTALHMFVVGSVAERGPIRQ